MGLEQSLGDSVVVSRVDRVVGWRIPGELQGEVLEFAITRTKQQYRMALCTQFHHWRLENIDLTVDRYVEWSIAEARYYRSVAPIVCG